MQKPTRLERRIDDAAKRTLRRTPRTGWRAGLVEAAVFLAKQAWACVFGALLLTVIVAARVWYPDDALIARNDALTIAAVLIQAGMIAGGLETRRELWVIVLFHLTGTAMEVFKTGVGSWMYDSGGVLHIAGVPLFSGFMYAAVGSYMVRVYRLFDIRFTRYPSVWATGVLAAAIYANFFLHHFWWDARWMLLLGVVAVWAPTMMHARVWRSRMRLPLLAAFAGVSAVIYVAENVGTWAGAWLYPNQVDGWEPVSVSKLSSWFLLMIISVVLVTIVYPPRRPHPAPSRTAVRARARPAGGAAS
ncbi:MAG: DUF817 domain-containing protein [Microbacterium sp.]|uniref:DUF817 domain-containing protein n=1 Tax=Microbacterium sp. TaxID=51671 RepID=UPI0039E2917B